ncbi:MAG: efflux RND transporter permease subunit [Alphaproteobacteria bacterium]
MSSGRSLGISGGLTKFFITSPLTPLFLLAALVLGVVALVALSREEEPQISVPMVDIMVAAPGLKAADVRQLVAKPLEEIVTSINAVEHVYTQIQDEGLTLTARFLVGTDEDEAILRVHEKLRANTHHLPVGIAEPVVVRRGINDVAIVTLTFTPKPEAMNRWDSGALTQLATEVNSQLAKVNHVGLTYLVGAAPLQLQIVPNIAQLNAYGISLHQLVEGIRAANTSFQMGTLRQQGQTLSLVAGSPVKALPALAQLVLTTHQGHPVYVKDVATLTVAPAVQEQRVWNIAYTSTTALAPTPAVTLAIAKRKGANAVNVSHDIEARLKTLRGTLIPDSVDVVLTRDYGETANEKANELLFHLALATLSIIALIVWMVGKRPGMVVAVVIPVTILLTLFAAYALGYTINRVSLFALIFSIGILVDDAIVVVENIHRHWAMKDKRTAIQAAIDAVAEVGNPTIIATLTVVTALLPMMFVSGLMGPYMSPIPAIASLAMVFSFFVAVVLTPWLMVRLDKRDDSHTHHADPLGTFYRKVATPFLTSAPKAKKLLWVVGILTLLSFALFPMKLVVVKLLPFDNKSELQILLNMPQGSSLEDTERTLFTLNRALHGLPELTSVQAYAGTAMPFNFNGLVRHYFLRQAPIYGDLQLNLLAKSERSRSSHVIALDVRERLAKLSFPPETVVKVVEVPPGPPVLSTLLAEIYGPDDATRRAVATKVKEAFLKADGVVDVDTSFPLPAQRLRFVIDDAKLNSYGVDRLEVYGTLRTLAGGATVGYSPRPFDAAPLPITITFAKPDLVNNAQVLALPLHGATGMVELGDVGAFVAEPASAPLFRHNGRDAEMVMAEMAGRLEAPIYGMGAVSTQLDKLEWGTTPKPAIKLVGQPLNESTPTLLWDGEWEVTATTFTDMGIAFAVALLGIYLLVVGQFGSFKLPIVILLPVPLSLLGIILGHALLQANFTAPSMIGFIALAGIIVRNSILLVDFIRHAPRKPNQPLSDILLEAGAVRFRPIVLTALAAMIGALFILTDPIFQGLAVSLLFGLLSSTSLTVLAVPAVYVIRESWKKKS